MVFSDYHHRLQHDESSSSNNNQATAGPSADDQPAGFCSVLFNLNRDLFNALQLSGRVSDEDTDEGFLAQNEAGRFRLWGDGFAVQDGGLDELLDGSVLQGAVVVQLVSIARKLRRYVDPDTDLLSHLDSTLEKAEYLFPEACEDEDLGLELLETLEDIAILNDGLYELTPFLESIPIEYEENDSLESLRLITAEGGEAKILYVNIIDKFPEAETFSPGLVNQLADLNLARKNRLWEAKKLHEAIPVSAGGGGGTGKGLGGYSPKSSLYTASSRYTTGSSVDSIPYSLMDLKEEYEYARSEASASSFNSADLDIVGRTRIPPPPIRLDGQEVSFECNLCFETLHSVSSKYQWKKHVFRDLKPYSCSFLHCPLPPTHLFAGRTDWIDHEFQSHRLLQSWVCIKDCGLEFTSQPLFSEHLKTHLGPTIPDSELAELVSACSRRKPLPESTTTVCPLCRDVIPETRKSIRRHLGRHMEEIALAVVPPENYSLTWEESTEEEEGDTSSSEEEGLVVVEEEADDDTAEPGSERDDSIWSRKEWIESILPKAVQRCIAREIKLDTEILERNRFDAHWKNQVFEWTAEHCGGRVHMMEVLLRELCEEVRKETKPEINLHPPGEDVGPDISEEIEKQLVGVKSQLGYTRCQHCKVVSSGTALCLGCGQPHGRDSPKYILPPGLRSRVTSELKQIVDRCYKYYETTHRFADNPVAGTRGINSNRIDYRIGERFEALAHTTSTQFSWLIRTDQDPSAADIRSIMVNLGTLERTIRRKMGARPEDHVWFVTPGISMEEYVWNSIRKGDETLYELFKISDTLNNRLIQEKGSFVLEKSQVADLRKRVENITSDLVGAFGLMEIYSPKNDPEGISLDPKQPPPEPLKETPKPSVVCKYFQQGRCSFGSLCKFSHPGQASPTPLGEGVPTKSPVICKYFQRGNCLFGSRCNYSHLDEPGTLSSADIGGETVIQPPAFSRKDDEDLLMPETEGLPETSAETDTGNADKALIDTPNTDQPRGTSLEADPAISEQQNKGQLYTDYTTKTASLSGKADNNASEDEQLAQMAVRVEQQKRRARAQEEDLALQMVLREEQQRRDHEREEKAVLQLAPKTLEDAEMLLEEQNKKRLIMARQEQDQIGTHGDTREDYLPLMTQECEACLETFDKPELFWCNICETTVCDSCWKLQEVHKHKRPGQSVHVKAGLRPNTGLERSWNTAVSTTGDFSTDGGFEVAQSRRSLRNFNRRVSQVSTDAGSEMGSHDVIGPDAITRTIMVERKYYPQLIGAGGTTLSEIILDSGGTAERALQSRMVRFPQRDSASERIVVTGPPQVVDGIVDRIRSKISQQENRRPKASFSEFLADVTQDNKTDWAAGRVSRDARAARNTPAKIEDAQARHRARSAERGFQRADTRYAETEYGRTTPVLGNAAEVAKRHMEQELGREEAPFDDPRMIQRRPTVPIGRLSFGKVFSPAPELGIVDSDGAGLQEVNRSSSDVRVMAEAEEHVEPGRRATKSSRRRNRKKKAAVGRRGSGDVGP